VVSQDIIELERLRKAASEAFKGSDYVLTNPEPGYQFLP
jgi:hypothetical protein